MSAAYQIWIDDQFGTPRLAVDSFLKLAVVKGENSGAWSLALPNFDRQQVDFDQFVEIWRKPDGGAAKLLMAGQIKTIEENEDTNGVYSLILGGKDARGILKSRIVAYAAGSSQATKTGAADDVMKAIVRENLGSSASASRDLSGYGLSVAADFALGPSISKVIGWKNVLTALNEIAATAKQDGTPVYYDLRPVALSTGKFGFVFETAVNQPRMDLTGKVFFGRIWGNLSEPKLIEDATDQISYVYAGGRGLEVSDSMRLAASVWGRAESYLDTKAEMDTNVMTALAKEELARNRTKRTFSARLLDTMQCRFGVEWDYGDRVTVQAFGGEYAGVIRTLQITYDKSGETLEARIDIDAA